MLSQMGARHIIALDLLPERLAYSKRNGATHTLQVATSIDEDVVQTSINKLLEASSVI
jgi:Zn-dependent alcohol dehydrogenase